MYICLGGVFIFCWCSPLPGGNDPIWLFHIFSDGLKPPIRLIQVFIQRTAHQFSMSLRFHRDENEQTMLLKGYSLSLPNLHRFMATETTFSIWMFPKIGVPQNGWFFNGNPIKMDDLRGKPTIFGNIHILLSLSSNKVQCIAAKGFSHLPSETTKSKHVCPYKPRFFP